MTNTKDTFQMSQKLRLAMRSLHRLVELKDMNVSNFLIETEKDLFLRHFNGLTTAEIQYLAQNFDSYHTNEKVEDVIALERTFQDVNAYMKTLN